MVSVFALQQRSSLLCKVPDPRLSNGGQSLLRGPDPDRTGSRMQETDALAQLSSNVITVVGQLLMCVVCPFYSPFHS
jgi:tRNA nucleotidyltransferase/poly(A) polymerase